MIQSFLIILYFFITILGFMLFICVFKIKFFPFLGIH